MANKELTMTDDRSKPPKTYRAFQYDSPNLSDHDKWLWCLEDHETDGYADTEAEAVAACWASYDSIAEIYAADQRALGRAEERAEIVAMYSRRGDNIIACEIERGEHTEEPTR